VRGSGETTIVANVTLATIPLGAALLTTPASPNSDPWSHPR
jgi:hypothetical protein